MIISCIYLLLSLHRFTISCFVDYVIYDRFLSRVPRCNHLTAKNSYSLAFIKYHLSLKYNYYNDRHQIFCIVRITVLQCEKRRVLILKSN